MSSEVDTAVALGPLDQIIKKPAVNIEFRDLKFSIKENSKHKGWRHILNSINGQFRSGELTGILGPSGAGKTTLLNILSGFIFREDQIQGSITVNGRPRNMSIFKKISAYIMHDDIVRSNLTVKEAMIYAASFKLNPNIKRKDKETVVEEVVNLLGLGACVDTFSECLSGGERKKLTIALELINNPPVIFLDEPTTGIDNLAVKQCIDLLNKISKLGTTVVCTIHQPSATLLRKFDQVYVIADGYCVYNGSPNQMVPFLSNANFSCPSNYTPSDHIIELVHSQPTTIEKLSSQIQNGKINIKESASDVLNIYGDGESIEKMQTEFCVPFRVQLHVLLSRMFLQMRRNLIALYIQFFHHLFSGFGIALLYLGIGNDGAQAYNILKFCSCCIVCLGYTYTMIPILLLPLEMRLLKKEYFNGWYSLLAYFTAFTVSALPLLVILTTLFSAITYFMTDQPLEVDRFIGFCLIMIAIAFTSQALGCLIGSIFNVTRGSIIGSAVLILFTTMSVYGMDYKSNIHPFYQLLMILSFMRHGFEGLCDSLFYEREPLTCEDVYCHYARPDILMVYASLTPGHYTYQFCLILIFAMIFLLMNYLSLKYRMKTEFSSRLIYCSKRLFRQK